MTNPGIDLEDYMRVFDQTFSAGEIVKFRFPSNNLERGTAEVSFVSDFSRVYVKFPGDAVTAKFYYPEELIRTSPLELLAEAADE